MSSDREEDHRSVLAAIGQLRESLVLSARDEEAGRRPAGCEGRQHQTGLRPRMARVQRMGPRK